MASEDREGRLAFQDFYPEDSAHCYGCGRLNERGHQLGSFWEGDETVAHFQPQPWHTAMPGYVYGGLIASLIDCHGTGTAAAVGARTAGYRLGEDPVPTDEPGPRYVTAALEVSFLAPTPLGPELTLRGTRGGRGRREGQPEGRDAHHGRSRRGDHGRGARRRGAHAGVDDRVRGPRYSLRMLVMGSTRVARCAGSQVAATDTRASTAATAPYVQGSRGLTS